MADVKMFEDSVIYPGSWARLEDGASLLAGMDLEPVSSSGQMKPIAIFGLKPRTSTERGDGPFDGSP